MFFHIREINQKCSSMVEFIKSSFAILGIVTLRDDSLCISLSIAINASGFLAHARLAIPLLTS
jgi:hypothetical protein